MKTFHILAIIVLILTRVGASGASPLPYGPRVRAQSQ